MLFGIMRSQSFRTILRNCSLRKCNSHLVIRIDYSSDIFFTINDRALSDMDLNGIQFKKKKKKKKNETKEPNDKKFKFIILWKFE